jgi:hypothetical protein
MQWPASARRLLLWATIAPDGISKKWIFVAPLSSEAGKPIRSGSRALEILLHLPAAASETGGCAKG